MVANSLDSRLCKYINIYLSINTQTYTHICYLSIHFYTYILFYGLPRWPWWSRSQQASVGDIKDGGSIPGSGRSPREGNGNPFHLPGKFHGQRSLTGYSSWVCTESDVTECLSTQAHTHTLLYMLSSV